MARALGADLGNSRTIQSLGNGHYEDSETTKVASQFAVHAVETADGISKLRELNDFTYPTRSSRFLGRMKLDTQNQSNDTYTAKASVPLKIIIAGAGLGGLATAIGLARTGHLVQVFEQAPALGEVGTWFAKLRGSAHLFCNRSERESRFLPIQRAFCSNGALQRTWQLMWWSQRVSIFVAGRTAASSDLPS